MTSCHTIQNKSRSPKRTVLLHQRSGDWPNDVIAVYFSMRFGKDQRQAREACKSSLTCDKQFNERDETGS